MGVGEFLGDLEPPAATGESVPEGVEEREGVVQGEAETLAE